MKAGSLVSRLSLPLAGLAIAVIGCGTSSPAAPERRGPITVIIQFDPADTQSTRCAATVDCGLYGCDAGTPHDITAVATWTVENPAVARIVRPGQIERVGPGDTVVRASQASVGEGSCPVSVFAGTAPLQTHLLTGRVSDGTDPARPPLDGATIEVLDGPVAGRTATSGVAPAFMPGYWTATVFYSGDYQFFGIPSGTYHLRASKPGYLPQERESAIGAFVQFVLERAG